MTELKKYTRKEIVTEKKRRDAVFIIDNLVYDVTPFLDEHPGGHEVLQNVAGTDASEAFDDIGHSLDAKELMRKYVVGELVAEDRIETKRQKVTWEQDASKPSESSFVGSWKFPVVVGVLMTIVYTYLFG